MMEGKEREAMWGAEVSEGGKAGACPGLGAAVGGCGAGGCGVRPWGGFRVRERG